jgi:hypothetical protein
VVPEQPGGTTGRRRAISIALIVLASVIGFFSVFAVWVKRQALETDTWTETSTELLENEDIRDAIADFLVDELYANIDVEAKVAGVLPPDLKPLAGPIAGGLRQAAGQVAREALAHPKFQAAWADANRAAHARLIAVIDDKGEFVSTGGGVVTLDLKGIAARVGTQVGLPGDLADKLPADTAQLEILRSDELGAVQTGAHVLRTLAWVLTALTLGLYALAIYIARGRRRETLRAVGFAFVAVGVLVLFAHGLAGHAVTESLADTAAAEPAVDATWTIATSLLVATGQAIIAYGIVIVLAAWLAGPSASATWVRRGITPYLRQPRVAYAGLAVLLALLFWWSPTEATRRLGPSLVLIAVLVLGVEVLRRQVILEFPDRVTMWSPEGTAQRIAARMREGRERRSGPPPAAESPDERRVSQLERLARLHEAGILSEQELAAEKRRILG